MALLNVGIVAAIDRAEGPFAPDTPAEFFLGLLDQGFFKRIGATPKREGANDKESDGECLQALTIIGKMTSDKLQIWRFR